MINQIEAILFDLDDTIFDRTLAQNEAISAILRMFPDLLGSIDENVARDAFFEADRLAIHIESQGSTLEEVLTLRSRTFLNLLGLGMDRAQEITEAYTKNYREISTPVNGSMSVLRVLSGLFPLGLVSNGYPDVQHTKIDSLKIRPFFEFTLISEEIGIRKPDPEIFLRAAQMLGVEPPKCLFVGDSYQNDIFGAKRAGMQACWLNRDRALIEGATIPDLEVSKMEMLIQALVD